MSWQMEGGRILLVMSAVYLALMLMLVSKFNAIPRPGNTQQKLTVMIKEYKSVVPSDHK